MKKILIFFLLLLTFSLISCVAPSVTSTSVSKVIKPSSRPARPEAPILQIDTGGHKAIIGDVIFTTDGRYLISASDDKTIRVWDVETGEIVRIIRGQIGEGSEGKIFAAALSSDNRLLAVGGFTKNDDIRLINFQTGEVIRLLKGHSNVINGLAFSPDSRRLISGSDDKTARVWDVRSGRSVHTLEGHTNRINAVAFSPDGKKTVTGSHDDTLKLWDVSSGSLIATMTGHTGDVASVAFTPDGRYILSGSYDKTIRLWDGRSGRFIKVLAKQDSTVDSLSISPDGTQVVTGAGFGYADGENTKRNNVYSIPSGIQITSFKKHGNIVLATAISLDGRTAATGGGNDSEIFLWDINTGRVIKKMVGKGNTVWSVGFAKDRKSIAWGRVRKQGNLFGRGPLEQSFQIKDVGQGFSLALGKELHSDSNYLRALESVGSLSIRTTNNNIHPTLQILRNNRAIHEITRKKPGDNFYSLTLTPDGKTILAGTSWELTAFNAGTGEKLKKFIGHTGVVWGVAVSPDSRYLVSGSSDQTVKIWEIETGKLLLTIFHGTDNEWVAWTPEGFFDASPNGAKYIGYHINRGEDKAADYVKVDQVYDLFYRPDLVAKKLEGGHEKEILLAQRRVNIEKVIASGIAPQVAFLSPQEGETLKKRDITLKLKLTDRGGGFGKIVYRLNGITIGMEEGSRGLKISPANRARSEIVEKLLTLQPGENHISVTAYNAKNEIESRPASISLFLKDAISERPSLYMLAIGINKYRDRALWLNYYVPDDRALSELIAHSGKSLFQNVKVVTLYDRDATEEGISAAFKNLGKEVKTNDLFILYMAGHGITQDGKYHFIPWDFIYKNEDSVRNNSINQDKLQNLLAMIPAMKSIILLDTCNSGSFTKLAARGMSEKTAIAKLTRATGRATIVASSDTQVALEGYKGHGVFTYALLEGIKGKADTNGNNNGEISINELAEYVSEEVPRITLKQWGYEQFPMQNLQGRSFPIGIVGRSN